MHKLLSVSEFIELWSTHGPKHGSLAFLWCLCLFPSEAPIRDVILHQTSGRIHNKNVSTHLIGSIGRGERLRAWGLWPNNWLFFSVSPALNQISCGWKIPVGDSCKNRGNSASVSQLPKKDSWIIAFGLPIALFLLYVSPTVQLSQQFFSTLHWPAFSHRECLPCLASADVVFGLLHGCRLWPSYSLDAFLLSTASALFFCSF